MSESKHLLKVFLCHASQDKSSVRELSQRLYSEGWIDTWLDEKKILPGQDWREVIEEAVESSDIVIICLSSNSVNKEGHVQKELRYAREIALEKLEGSIFLIPLRIDECEVPRGVRFYQWADYFGEKKDETYNSLLEALKLRYEQKLNTKNEEPAHGSRGKLESAITGKIPDKEKQKTSIKEEGVKGNSKFFMQLALGAFLPPFACLLTTTAYVSRYYLKGIWTSGVMENVIIVSGLLVLLFLSFILFILGVKGLGKAVVGYGASLKDGFKKISEYLKQHPNWLEAMKNVPQAIKPYLNYDLTDFNERFVAIILSLFIPGSGLLYRGRIWLGILSFVFTVVGYIAEFFPGLLLHLLVIIISGLIEKPQKAIAVIEEEKPST